MLRRHPFFSLILALAASACTSSVSPGPDGAGGTTAAGPGSTSSTGGQKNCPDGQLCLAPPAKGFQIQSIGEMIQPGQDVEYCEVVTLPGGPTDVYYVNRFEVAMTKHSHHLIVVAAEVGSSTEMKMMPGAKKKCFTPDAFGGEVYGVTGSQHPYNEEKYPSGVGKKFVGGQKLVFDYHYFNSTTAAVQARAAVNFHTVDAATITKEAHGFGFYNFGIATPPMSTKSFTAQCTFSQDLLVSKVTRHTHQWGTDFSVSYVGGENDGKHIWTSPNYEETEHIFPQPVLMKKGTGFRFTCNFNNTTPKTLKFGVTASDEMCILFGTWFVVNAGDPEKDQGCTIN
jgi:hypothetical protein